MSGQNGKETNNEDYLMQVLPLTIQAYIRIT
ncbi:MAG: hypothetical protein K0S28_2188 [Paucimonas sp.]|jgi:hypothetical protein|nr:hypothetical protein [Paucimonas sp.]